MAQLRLKQPWRDQNAAMIEGALMGGGVAAFDWDETCAMHDGGDLFWLYMALNDLFKQPPEREWGALSAHLTDEARVALHRVAAPLAAPGEPLPSRAHHGFAAILRSVYLDGRTLEGAPAWRCGPSACWEPGYAFAVQLQWGWRAEEIRRIAEDAARWLLSQPVGAEIDYGDGRFCAWVRIYPQMSELLGVLQEAGFTRRIISASAQPFVEAMAERAGLSASEVIGARVALNARGEQTTGFAACGPYPEGHQALMTYREGKRAWLNADLYGLSGEAVFQPTRLDIAGGDSISDLDFLLDARRLRLIIGAHPALLAAAEAGGPWLIQPTFQGYAR